ncbi:MAG: phosphate acyltransferase PlsX [Candidatus Glassbacteria bacterium]
MRIAIDAMGGDRAPAVPVEGALEALNLLGNGFEIILVGNRELIEKDLSRRHYKDSRLEIVHASQVVEMDDSPSVALKKKRDSSISVGLRMQKEDTADAFVSAGNTGAIMAQSLMTLGRIEGISRPAIVTIFPSRIQPVVFLDVGANVDSKPFHLLHFALMGSIYAQEILGRENPKVGLLNIGEEAKKGDELSVATYKMLDESPLNFIGNAEGRDILDGVTDVVVCDGFVGNVVLKFSESIIHLVTSMIKSEIRKSPVRRLGSMLMRGAYKNIQRTLDYAEYGGAPLLGIDGVVVVCHGGSSPKAIRNAINVARLTVTRRVNETIETRLSELSNAKAVKLS